MRQIYIFILSFISFQFFAQQNITDSLKQCLKLAKTDSTKLRIYSQLSEVCDQKDIPLYSTPAIALAEAIFKNNSSSLKTINSEINLSDSKLPAKFKKSLLNYYGRALNSQGIYEISHGNNLQGIKHFEKALKAQTENNDTLEMATTLNNIGSNLYYIGEIKKSQEAFDQSLILYRKLNNKIGMAQAYNGISMLQRSKGDILSGIDYMFKSLKISEELNDKQSMANQYNNLCVFYLDLEDYQKAFDYGQKSLALSKKLNLKNVLGNSYTNLGYLCLKRSDTTKALEYLNLSLNLSLETGSKNDLVNDYNNIGVIYKDKKKYTEAIGYFEKALLLAEEIASKDGQANSHTKLGSVYLILNNKNMALKHALKSYELSRELGTPIDIRNASELLKKVYESTNQYKQALEMSNIYYAMRDSILNNNNRREGIKKQYKYDYDKKSIADSIKNVNEQKINQTTIALQNSEIKQQTILRYVLIIGIVLVGVFVLFFYNRFRVTQIQKNIIQQQQQITNTQKTELEIKNKNIMESIEMAKEIQYIIFPSEDELNKSFIQHFMFFKPCEVLSGDFLWLKTVEKKTFLILCDCTGHGIPASLLTMFANEFLNKIIIQKKINTAAEILSLVNEEIYNYLKRKQKNIKTLNEGMDIGICVLDELNNNLSFCGARINLFYTNKENVLKCVNGNKLFLGQELLSAQTFTEQNLPLGSINNIYLTTDGLTDQLKYKSNKNKFGFKGFENFITKNSELLLEEQKNNLNDIFGEITTQHSQIDDILVFAGKISN